MKAINNSWLTTRGGCIGIVLAENEYGQQAYITVVPGNDEEQDIKNVMDWGSKLDIAKASGFFPGQIDEERYGNT
jgi:hypothetical protein